MRIISSTYTPKQNYNNVNHISFGVKVKMPSGAAFEKYLNENGWKLEPRKYERLSEIPDNNGKHPMNVDDEKYFGNLYKDDSNFIIEFIGKGGIGKGITRKEFKQLIESHIKHRKKLKDIIPFLYDDRFNIKNVLEFIQVYVKNFNFIETKIPIPLWQKIKVFSQGLDVKILKKLMNYKDIASKKQRFGLAECLNNWKTLQDLEKNNKELNKILTMKNLNKDNYRFSTLEEIAENTKDLISDPILYNKIAELRTSNKKHFLFNNPHEIFQVYKNNSDLRNQLDTILNILAERNIEYSQYKNFANYIITKIGRILKQHPKASELLNKKDKTNYIFFNNQSYWNINQFEIYAKMYDKYEKTINKLLKGPTLEKPSEDLIKIIEQYPNEFETIRNWKKADGKSTIEKEEHYLNATIIYAKHKTKMDTLLDDENFKRYFSDIIIDNLTKYDNFKMSNAETFVELYDAKSPINSYLIDGKLWGISKEKYLEFEKEYKKNSAFMEKILNIKDPQSNYFGARKFLSNKSNNKNDEIDIIIEISKAQRKYGDVIDRFIEQIDFQPRTYLNTIKHYENQKQNLEK